MNVSGQPTTPGYSLADFIHQAVDKWQDEFFPVMLFLFTPREKKFLFKLYTLLRCLDDIADSTILSAEQKQALLAQSEAEWKRTLGGERSSYPLFNEVAALFRVYALSPEYIGLLISAFRQDTWKTRYQTFAEFKDYCRRSANPVGRLMLQRFKCHRPELLPCADALCTALQFANMLRDYRDDLAMGRIYIPEAEMLQYAVTAEDLDRDQVSEGLSALMFYQLD